MTKFYVLEIGRGYRVQFLTWNQLFYRQLLRQQMTTTETTDRLKTDKRPIWVLSAAQSDKSYEKINIVIGC